jgi:hypothetical protein
MEDGQDLETHHPPPKKLITKKLRPVDVFSPAKCVNHGAEEHWYNYNH